MLESAPPEANADTPSCGARSASGWADDAHRPMALRMASPSIVEVPAEMESKVLRPSSSCKLYGPHK